MALVKEIFDGIDKVLDNFGPPMIRPNYYDTVRPLDYLETLIQRPIGLYYKDYRFIADHLNRNVGNGTSIFDGYATPIGYLANPYYNEEILPYFYNDPMRVGNPNYIEYIRSAYSPEYSTMSIRDFLGGVIDVRQIMDKSSVGYVSGARIPYLLEHYNKIGGTSIHNPNSSNFDTNLGYLSSYYLANTLRFAMAKNDDTMSIRKSISLGMKENFGFNSFSYNNAMYSKSELGTDAIRFEEGKFNPIYDFSSPLDGDFKWGNYSSLGAYRDFFESLTTEVQFEYNKNINRNQYRLSLDEGTEGATYLSKLNIVPDPVSLVFDGSDDTVVGFNLIKDTSSRNLYNRSTHYTYAESEGGERKTVPLATYNEGSAIGGYVSFDESIGVDDLLRKTNDNFRNGKYKTLISRFHTEADDTSPSDITQTAISAKYGASHGRNLLKRNHDGYKSNDYSNPYCRVWTEHYQYNKLKNVIRPFIEGDKILTQKELERKYNFGSFRNVDATIGKTGSERLDDYGVKNSINGLISITPTDGDEVNIKQCMFSIENLAWKGVSQKLLSKSQKGPFGGRIMWFPPYDISFNEQVDVSWSENNFIGRGEPVSTYSNTRRTGTLKFKLLIDHPSVIDYWRKRRPDIKTNGRSSVDDVDSAEQTLLRFFAGCDMLNVAPKKQPTPKIAIQNFSNKNEEYITYTSFVFFPNDYSGIDELDVNDAVDYLMNGIGTGNVNERFFNGQSWSGGTIGGYEIREGRGISIVSENLNPNNNVIYSNDGLTFYKLIGKTSQGGKRTEWFYRIDNDRLGSTYVYKSGTKNSVHMSPSYLDTTSFGLNSTGVLNYESKLRSVGLLNNNSKLIPFSELYWAFVGDGNRMTKYMPNNSRADLEFDISDIKEIVLYGHASSHDITNNVKDNTNLRNRRASTIMKWLNSHKSNDFTVYTSKSNNTTQVGSKTGDINDINAKIWRSVRIDIKVAKDSVKNVIDLVTFDGAGTKNPKNNKKGLLSTKNSSNADPITNYQYQEGYNEKDIRLTEGLRNLKFSVNDNVDTIEDIFESDYSPAVNNGTNILNRANSKDDIELNEIEPEAGPSVLESQIMSNETMDESEFFKLLTLEDTTMRDKLTEKIKYFDPAYHAISPEGFNARLTFLHQCTRQGPTVSASDPNARTANNMSFGRPPVCILRIGDFYYTRVLFNSLNIDYDPLLWDLNTEGIGVMPMIANVTMGFTFIGGSNLSGPISRLQNAVSHNYYANTEVYDPKAEQAVYDDNGNLSKLKPYNPTIK